MKYFSYLNCTFLIVSISVQCCSSRSNIDSVSSDDWKSLYDNDILVLSGKESEPIKCSKIGRGASKLMFLLDLSSRNTTVDFFLSTRSNRSLSKVTSRDNGEIGTMKHFDPKKTTYIITHGWLSNANETWVNDMKNALLDWEDANVIAVDWSCGGSTLKYWKAVKNIESAGNQIAILIQRLIKTTGLSQKRLHFIGHSLGAHISSFAAVKLGKVRRITGLDPAHTCTITTDKNYLLDKSDADFVDVIHTSATMLIKFGFGTRSAIGHVDFYPNGGETQPKCTQRKRTPFSKLIPFYRGITTGICNHGRAYDLFIESLKSSDCPLVAHNWDRTTERITESLKRKCSLKNCSVMGIYADRSPARGTFYVTTLGAKQYCDSVKNFYDKLISNNGISSFH